MKKITRILSLALAIVMLLSVAVVGASAEETTEIATSGTVESIDWVYTAEDKTITVTGNIEGTGTVPYLLAQTYWKDLDYNRIIVNEGIGEIIGNGFNGCKAETIILPTTLRKIGEGAFKNSKQLKWLHIPVGVTTIGSNIIQGCTLTSVYVPNTIKSINGNWAYNNNGAPFAKLYVFNGIGSGYDTIKAATYDKFTSITVQVNTVNFKADRTVAYGSFATVAAAATSGDTVTVLSNVTATAMPEIAEGVNMVYQANVGASATWNNQYWKYFLPTKTITVTPTSNSDGSIGNSGGASLADQWKNYDYDTVIIGEGFTKILQNGLNDGKASKLILPSTLKTIGTQAMVRWYKLTQLHIPVGVTTIGGYPFKDAPLTSIYFPNTITSLNGGWNTNLNKKGELKVYYSAGGALGPGNFSGKCASYVAVDAMKTDANGYHTYGGFKSIVENAVAGETVTVLSYATVNAMPTIPEGVKVIYLAGVGAKATLDSSKWEYNAIDKTITVVPVDGGNNIIAELLASEWSAYDYNNVVISEGFTSLGKNSLNGVKVKEIKLPSTLTSIGEGALKNAKIECLEIPKGVTTLGQYPFENCDLDYIFIPNTVTSFGSWYTGLTVDKVYYTYSEAVDNEVNLRFAGKTQIVDSIKTSSDGTTVYSRLKNALNNAQDGDVFKLIDNINDNHFVTAVSDFTIDLNGNKVSNIFVANTNGDEKINILDLVVLKKKIANINGVEINTAGLEYRSEFSADNMINLTNHLLGIAV